MKVSRLTLMVVAEWAELVGEHACVAALMSAGVDQLPLLAFVERHRAAWTDLAGLLGFQQLTYSSEIWKKETGLNYRQRPRDRR